jgi:O-acetyl-ADP-ribose deacetylase (regulator of RNase III)
MKITYLNGDATKPQGESPVKIITHICNDKGYWASGFVVALSERWKEPEQAYRAQKGNYILGDVIFVEVEDNVFVANMIAQHGIKSENNISPIRYGALETCLEKVDEFAKLVHGDVHMPRIGTVRAGGKWEVIVKIIRKTISVDVTVYDLF